MTRYGLGRSLTLSPPPSGIGERNGKMKPVGWWLCPLPAPAAPPACPLAWQREKLKSPGLSVSTALQQLKHQCGINIILVLIPKHSTVPATRRKTNSILAESRTPSLIQTTLTSCCFEIQAEYAQLVHLSAVCLIFFLARTSSSHSEFT